jgi:hypothetical protein
VIPAKDGIHFRHAHRLEPVLGSAEGRTPGPM